MPRQYQLPEPLASLADDAGSEAKLQAAMGGVPSTTFHRWKKLILAGKPLPRAAVAALALAKERIKKTRTPAKGQKENP